MAKRDFYKATVVGMLVPIEEATNNEADLGIPVFVDGVGPAYLIQTSALARPEKATTEEVAGAIGQAIADLSEATGAPEPLLTPEQVVETAARLTEQGA